MEPIRLTKPEALKKLKTVRRLLQILEENYPSGSFHTYYAWFSSVNGYYWLSITNYWNWCNAEFQEFLALLQQAAHDDGFTLQPIQNHPVALYLDRSRCAKKKDMFVNVKPE